MLGLEYKFKSLEGEMMNNERSGNRWQKWTLALVPILITGAVVMVLAWGRQQDMDAASEKTDVRVFQVESRIGAIESDINVIKVEQQHTREAVNRVADSVEKIGDSQKRVESTIQRRR